MQKQAFIQRAIDGAWNNTVKPLGKSLTTLGKGIGNTVGGAGKAVWNVAAAPVNAGLGALKGGWQGMQRGGLGGGLQGAFDGAYNTLKTDGQDIANAGKQFGRGLAQTTVGGVESAVRSVASPWMAAYGAAAGTGTHRDPGNASFGNYGINAQKTELKPVNPMASKPATPTAPMPPATPPTAPASTTPAAAPAPATPAPATPIAPVNQLGASTGNIAGMSAQPISQPMRQPSAPVQQQQPDAAYLQKVMGSYNPNSPLDKRKAEAIQQIWQSNGGRVSPNQIYKDPRYTQIKNAFARLG